MIQKTEAVIKKGDKLTKVNFGSSGRKIKFFRLCSDNCLKWADSESEISNASKKHTIPLKDVQAVILGNTRETF